MLNLDSNEVAKFEKLAQNWWDPNGECKPLHEINPLRLQFIQNNAELAGKQVLDMGCGGGILSEALALVGGQVTAIDMSQEALTVAKLHQNKTGVSIDYQQTTAEEFAALYPGKFDVITCMELLEHVPDPSSVIKACATLLKPNGQLFFSTLNRTPKAYLFAIVGAEYLLKLLPRGTHDYAKFIRPSELAAWARAADLNVEKLAGMEYQLLTRDYKLSDDVSVNYLVCCIKA